MNPEVTERLARYTHFREEMEKLREIVLACGLTEVLKWEEPCYMAGDANVLIIHGFKEYFALLFFKGSLMADPDNVLIQQTENVQAGRQIRFTSMDQVTQMEPIIHKYVEEAIRVEKAGIKIEYRKTEDYDVPDELRDAFNTNAGFQNAFENLTPGRQRGYLLFFAGAKQSKTREERIAKWMDAIFDGIGLQDEYTQSKRADNRE